MPTYQYRCTACDRELEIVQKFSDPSLTECPSCSGALRKVFNAVGVVFKGSGFYRTDSRAKSEGDTAPAAATATATKESAPSTDSSSKESSGNGSSGKGSSGNGPAGNGNSKSGDSASSGSAPSKSKTSSSTGSKAASD